MTKAKSVDPALQGVRAWNALDNIVQELRSGLGIGPSKNSQYLRRALR